MHFSRIFQITVTSLVTVMAMSTSSWAQRGGGVAVSTAFVEEEIVSDTTTIPGAVVAPSAFVISALRSDAIDIEPLQIGGFVRKGTKIASQNVENLSDQRDILMLQIEDAQAQINQTDMNISYESELLAVAEQQLILVTQRAVRAQKLAEKKAISAEAAETSQSAQLNSSQQVISRKQAIERLKATKAASERTILKLQTQIAQIDRDMAKAQYKAPENGLILSLPSYRSGFARQGDVIARIQGFRGFEVQAEIPSAYLRFLREAPEVDATDGQGNDLTLKFRTALPEEDRRTSTRPVRFTIQGELPRSLSANGARIDMQIPIRQADASLLVPQDAIIPVPGGHVVFVFDDGKAARQVVRLGGTVNDMVIVTSGLAAGERVIVKGNEGLSDGAAVKEGTPPKRKVPSGEESADDAPQEAALETELADDAVVYLLEWKTRRGDSSAELTLSSKANLYDGEPIRVTKTGDKLAFDAEVVLPFGILTLSFDGTLANGAMTGMITMSGLPNGNTPSFPFTGKAQ